MFIAELPLLFIVRANPDSDRLIFRDGYMVVRYQIVPGLHATQLKLIGPPGPWSILEAPPREDARIFIVKLDGAAMTALAKKEPNHPTLLALYDQRVIELPLQADVVPFPRGKGDSCKSASLTAGLFLMLALEIS